MNSVGRSEETYVDVWSRTERKYRRRALVLMAINIVLFGGICCVAYWLRTGVVFAPASGEYWSQLVATFHISSQTEHTPLALGLDPISIVDVPMMIVVLGLVLAALVSIPIVVSILYRFWWSIPFSVSVGFLGVMPWLAITLVASCLIASVKPFRVRSRYASALMSLVPIVVYMFMASRQVSGAVEKLANPSDFVKLQAMLSLSLIAAAVVMGIVLTIARLVNYRPGAIAPLMAILFVSPAIIFEFQVGRDELHYRLLERNYGPGSQYMVSRDIQSILDPVIESRMADPENKRSFSAVRDQLTLRVALAMDPEASREWVAYQDKAALAVNRFVHLFPDSRYATAALYIKGRALDMRPDFTALEKEGRLVFFDDFPNERSRLAWEMIEANGRETPQWVVAGLHLARLDVRAGEVDRAISRLRRGIALGQSVLSSEGLSREDRPLMGRKLPEASLEIPIARKILESRIFLELLERNRDPIYGDVPLREFAGFAPRTLQYARHLEGVIERYPNCQLADNLRLEMARSIDDAEQRSVALGQCTLASPAEDSVAGALYSLGETYRERGEPVAAARAFERVVTEFSESAWRGLTDARVRELDRTGSEAD